jgi:hypothetical protein
VDDEKGALVRRLGDWPDAAQCTSNGPTCGWLGDLAVLMQGVGGLLWLLSHKVRASDCIMIGSHQGCRQSWRATARRAGIASTTR